MNSTELLDLFRLEMADTATPYLWSDDEAYVYMDDGQKTFCRLTDGIPDSRTAAVTQLEFVAGESWAALSPKVRQIRRAWNLDTGEKVDLYTAEQAESAGITFAETLTGPVRGIVTGLEKNAVRATRVPTADATVQMSVYRLPLVDITVDGDQEFEIDAQHVLSLLLWMKHRAYDKQDAETFDRRKSDDFQARFRAYCAQAQQEQQRARRVHGNVVYGGV